MSGKPSITPADRFIASLGFNPPCLAKKAIKSKKRRIVGKGNLSDQLTRTLDGERLFLQEQAVMEVTETISRIMQEVGMTKKMLARKLGISECQVTSMLGGYTNPNIRMLSDIFFHLGRAGYNQKEILIRFRTEP